MKVKIAVFIDALGWEIVEQYSFMKELDYRKKVQMQFGYSSTALPTILTGKTPEVHEHFTMFYLNKVNSPLRHSLMRPLKLLPSRLETNWRIRNIVSKFIKKIHGITGYLNLYSIPIEKLEKLDFQEKKDIFNQGGIDNCKNISDYYHNHNKKIFMSDYQAKEIDNVKMIKKALTGSEIEFGFLYLAELDALLHKETKDGKNISLKLKWYEDKIREVYNVAKEHYNDVELCIFSDHGMTTFLGEINVKKALENTHYKEGIDYDVLLDSTMARFWYASNDIQKEIQALMKRIGLLRVTEKQLSNWGCYFKDSKYGEDIFLADPGVQIIPNDYGLKPLKGMHGYSPVDKDSYACFISNFIPSMTPQWVGDFYELMQ